MAQGTFLDDLSKKLNFGRKMTFMAIMLAKWQYYVNVKFNHIFSDWNVFLHYFECPFPYISTVILLYVFSYSLLPCHRLTASKWERWGGLGSWLLAEFTPSSFLESSSAPSWQIGGVWWVQWVTFLTASALVTRWADAETWAGVALGSVYTVTLQLAARAVPTSWARWNTQQTCQDGEF